MIRNKYQIGDYIKIIGSGELWGIVVDFDDEFITVAFPNKKEFLFHEIYLQKLGQKCDNGEK